jgi:hypothetical protein
MSIEIGGFGLAATPYAPQGLTPQPSSDTVVSHSAIDTILTERGTRYGPFAGHAHITQMLKDDMRGTARWHKLTPSQAEALEMIAHKIGRILNGDPNYDDSWRDIGGYAELIVKQLNGKAL